MQLHRIDPCIPRDWVGYTIQRTCTNAGYRITVHKTDCVCKGIKELTVDGHAADSQILPVFTDGQCHA